uniref:EGF-like domain-containing protein n=1 Tax=Mola mola TaxID=94237 RepID=A0A3Q3WE68_MOLML
PFIFSTWMSLLVSCALFERKKNRFRQVCLICVWCIFFLVGSEQSRSCCKNGGTCILGSFCACPPFFSGRSCQYDQRNRSCGMITHGEWVQKGCSYCRCGYGILHCFPSVFHKDCAVCPPIYTTLMKSLLCGLTIRYELYIFCLSKVFFSHSGGA